MSDIYITENDCSATDVPAADGLVYDTVPPHHVFAQLPDAVARFSILFQQAGKRCFKRLPATT